MEGSFRAPRVWGPGQGVRLGSRSWPVLTLLHPERRSRLTRGHTHSGWERRLRPTCKTDCSLVGAVPDFPSRGTPPKCHSPSPCPCDALGSRWRGRGLSEGSPAGRHPLSFLYELFHQPLDPWAGRPSPSARLLLLRDAGSRVCFSRERRTSPGSPAFSALVQGRVLFLLLIYYYCFLETEKGRG